MSKIKISDNLFLEVNELNHLVRFLAQDGWQRAFKTIVKRYGIVRNEENSNFKPTKTDNATVTLNAGLAFNDSMEAILLRESKDITITENSTKQWILIERNTTNYEEGTVSISPTGDLTGVGTRFLEVLRGQPNFPTKIAFNSSNNPLFYEVVSVTSDTQAVISGILTAENNLRYKVGGTFTPGFNVTSDNIAIYEYDDCTVTVVASSTVPALNEGQYIVASVVFADGVMSVTDERDRNYMVVTESDEDAMQYDGLNPFASITRITNLGLTSRNNMFEFVLEHGYTIDSYQYSITQSANVLTILAGHSNAIPSIGALYDTVFDGWILLNLKNMKSAKITQNIGTALYVPTFTEDFLTGSDDRLVVLPDYDAIEYSVTVNSATSDINIAFTVTVPIGGGVATRLNLSLLQPQFNAGTETVTATVKYRMIKQGKLFTCNAVALTTYTDADGVSRVVGDGGVVTLKVLDREEEIRNYS